MELQEPIKVVPAPRPKVKKTKQGRYTADITKEEIEQYFHLPSEEACKQLGVGLTILKRLCRRFGIERWPYRRASKGGSKAADTKQPASLPCSSSSGDGDASGGSSSSAPKHQEQQQQHSTSAHTTGGSGASAATTRQSTDCGTTTGSLPRAGSDRLTVECNGLRRVGSLKRGRSTEVASVLPLAAALGIASPAAATAAANNGALQQQSWTTHAAAEADLLADELGAHRLMQASSLKKRKSLELAGDALDQALLLEQVAATAPAERLRSGLSTASLLRASSTPVQLALERHARQPPMPLTALPLRRAGANEAPRAQGQRPLPDPLPHVEGGLAGGASRDAVARWQEQQLSALTALVKQTKNPQAASLPEIQGSSVPAAQRGLTLSASDAMLASFTDPSPRSPSSQPQLSGITTDSGCLLHNASDSGGQDPLGWDRGEGTLGTPQSLLSPAACGAGASMLALGMLPAMPPAAAAPPQPDVSAAVPTLGLSDPCDQDLVSPFSLVNQEIKPEDKTEQLLSSFARPDVGMAALPSPLASASDQGSLASGERGLAHVSIAEAPMQAVSVPSLLAQQQQRASTTALPTSQSAAMHTPSPFVQAAAMPTPSPLMRQQQAPGFLPRRQPANVAAPAAAPAPDPDLLALQQMWSQDIDLIMHEDDVKKLLADLEASERLLPPLPPRVAAGPGRQPGGAAVPAPKGRDPVQCVQLQQFWVQSQAAGQVAMQGPWTGVGASGAAAADGLQRYASAPVANSYSWF